VPIFWHILVLFLAFLSRFSVKILLPATKMEGRSRQTLRSTADAIAKLRQASQTINRREGLQPSESKRVREALRITVQSGDVANSDAAEGDVYELFLRKVSNHAGPQMVVLCAVGLGRTVVKALKDRIRVDLPFAIKDQAATLESEVIQDLVEKILPEGTVGHIQDTCTADIWKHNLKRPQAKIFLYSTLRLTIP
jgi:hypothetical protein